MCRFFCGLVFLLNASGALAASDKQNSDILFGILAVIFVVFILAMLVLFSKYPRLSPSKTTKEKSSESIWAAKLIFVLGAGLVAYLTSIAEGAYNMALMNVLAAVFVGGGLIRTNMSISGHGVNGSRHILRMPILLLVIYISVVILLCGLGSVAVTVDAILLPETLANVKTFPLAVFFGWLAGVLDWYSVSYEMTYYESEYEYRHDLLSRGLTMDEVHFMARDARQKGVFGPRKE